MKVRTLVQAYADDLTLGARNARGAQAACDHSQRWLEWSITMRAKPRKCVALGLKQFDRRIKGESFVPLNPENNYSPFDPQLSIAGKKMQFIVDPSKGKFKGEHFKFLGRWVHYYSDEAGIKERIRSTFEDDLQTVAAANVNGFMKLWLYERYVLSRHSWSLMVHDLDRSFASGLQTHAQALLKRWAGVGKESMKVCSTDPERTLASS